jgi:hypothetical protein
MLLEKTRNALERIVKAFEEGRLGARGWKGRYYRVEKGCCYRVEGQFCAIGCLLSESTLDKIEDEGMNFDTPASALFQNIPEAFEEAGLTISQASVLQALHDQWAEAEDPDKAMRENEFIGGIKRVLAGEITYLNSRSATASFHDGKL